MDIKQLDSQVSISADITCADLQQLAHFGVQVVVCNRLQGEVDDQASLAELSRAAAGCGIEFVAIPFARGQMQAGHCKEFAEILDSGKKVHAFCRTGNRACNLWAAAKCGAGADGKTLMEKARGAGFDVSGTLIVFGR
ncbi:TIGR01244 family sulfur transferase [Microbulbifer rhizosphaerae]|uniref:Sulfide:quinone oxidoreductase n=1 Tax=Microbulbifer rhizosphaerae TaxID=1562603 RepID=A0A7W4Z8M1_9GAMM|nr:TIGR01244 family sulfur transferase [Microbulbifer rhizosphaerae]MBB3060732.1 sulfide:quinone oxidoreductase [Microbulbifer rhizosphaerae]